MLYMLVVFLRCFFMFLSFLVLLCLVLSSDWLRRSLPYNLYCVGGDTTHDSATTVAESWVVTTQPSS